MLPFIGKDERDQALDDLASRSFPRLDFFLYTLLAAFLIGLSFVFSSPVLMVAGLAFSPLPSPLTGTALGLVTGSYRFAVRNLAALIAAWILAFLAAWAGAYLFAFLPSRGAYPPMPDLFTAAVVILAAVALTWRFLRGAADAWMPGLIVAFGGLYPICAAAGLAATGAGGAATAAGLTWAIHTGLSLLASIGTYLAFGFRPSERDIRAYAGIAAAGIIGIALLAAWAVTLPAAAPATAPAAGTPSPILLPTASSTFTLSPSVTLTATISPLPSHTPKPSATLTPTGTPVPAVVRGTGGQGVFLRDGPGLDGKKIASLQEGDIVEVLGPPVEKDGTLWIPVRTDSGLEGWMALEFCATATPVATRA